MPILNMSVNFGFACSERVHLSEEIRQKVTFLMKEFLSKAQAYNTPDYGFSAAKIRCNIFSGDDFCSDHFNEVAASVDATATVVTALDNANEFSNSVIALNLKKQSLSYPSIIAEYVVNKSDVLFLIRDGKQSFRDGILWTIQQFCKQKKIPYYLINTAQLDDVSFTTDSYHTPYTPERVDEYVKSLYGYEESEPINAHIPLSKTWIWLHDRFIKKHKLKASDTPYIEDKLLSGAYFTEDTAKARNHKMLTEYFSYYDKKAIEASSMYRASVYFRSILPMLATVFIAVGFYAETVMTFFFGKHEIFQAMSIWTVLAALGFLVHALLNRYASRTSKNPHVNRLRKDFIEARYIAEYLRVAIHSEAYGIQIDNVLSGGNDVDKSVKAKLHHIIRQQEPTDYIQDEKAMRKAAYNFKALMSDQKNYHHSCIKRYEFIKNRLSHLASAFYLIGFIIVVSRGFLQFVVPFVFSGFNFSSAINGIKIESFIKSFANMLALVMPAWASYFSTKLNMNGYEWLWNNSCKLKAEFDKAELKLERLTEHTSHTYQIISDVANDILTLTREDYTNWYRRMDSQRFTRL